MADLATKKWVHATQNNWWQSAWINIFWGILTAVKQSQNKPQERYRIRIEWFECSKINSALCNCTGRSWKQRRMFSHGETNWASPWIHFKEILTVYSFWICHNIELEIYSAQLVSSLFPLEMFKAKIPLDIEVSSISCQVLFDFLDRPALWKPSVKKCNKAMDKLL